MNQHLSTRLLSVVATLVTLLGASTSVRAQAWTPAQGEGTVALEYQNGFNKFHLMPDGDPQDRGHVRTDTMLVDFTYGITHKLALSVGLPYVTSKYNGVHPHPTPLDDGSYHSTFQDFRFGLSYNVSRRGLVVTPFVGTILPSHAYEYYAHSAPGRDLHELQVGAYWAKLLDPIFVTGRYSYAFSPRVLDISHNRSNVDLELGYFIKPEVRVFALGSGQLTHGGIDVYPVDLYPNIPPLSPVLLRHHDQLANDDMLNLGGGASYSLTPSMDLFGSIIHTAAGKNAHALQYGLTVGVTWSFMRGSPGVVASHSAAVGRGEAQARSLAKCVCQKGR